MTKNGIDKDYKLFQGAEDYVHDLMRSFRIWGEFRKGFNALRKVENCVTIFGSARLTPDNPYYQMAYDTAYLLGQNGRSIMTGGGPGIMAAANKGAKDAGALSIGCSIKLPHESPNPYTDININFDHFFVRKVMLLKYSSAFILLPGGLGTMDEAFELATLMNTKKIGQFPFILMGQDYWRELRPFINCTMIKNGTLDEHELGNAIITDDPKIALDNITDKRMYDTI